MLTISILLTSEEEGLPRSLPPTVLRNIASLKCAHPNLEHRLFRLPELSWLIRREFGGAVYSAFNTLVPFAYKADLARYCLLHHFGGVYADLSYFLVSSLPIEPGRITVFRDFLWSAPWDTSNGMIAAPAGHRAFEVAIDQICANVRNRYYGPTTLCPTGPALFGQSLAIACAADELICGSAKLFEKRALEQDFQDLPLPENSGNDSNIHCLTMHEKIIAIKMKEWGSDGISSLGVVGGDSYPALWESRKIYSE